MALPPNTNNFIFSIHVNVKGVATVICYVYKC